MIYTGKTGYKTFGCLKELFFSEGPKGLDTGPHF